MTRVVGLSTDQLPMQMLHGTSPLAVMRAPGAQSGLTLAPHGFHRCGARGRER
jgi:hypothetical protein